jgi:hypothetical protein
MLIFGAIMLYMIATSRHSRRLSRNWLKSVGFEIASTGTSGTTD